MADISTDYTTWSTTAGNNNPSASTNIGTGLDDNLRAIQAGVANLAARDAAQTLTDGATVAWDTALGGIATLTLSNLGGTTRTVNAPTNLKTGTYLLFLIQGDATARGITWASAFKWSFNLPPVLSSGSGKKDVVAFICDGTYLMGSFLPDVRNS